MTEIRISPDGAPGWWLPLVPALAALVTRAVAMGVLSGPPVTSLDASTVERLVVALQAHGVAKEAKVVLSALTNAGQTAPDAGAQRLLASHIDRLSEALEASAVPATEWPSMRAVFGDGPLMELLGISGTSLKRYATGSRPTPDEIGERLHWVAMVVADLAGAYNDFGIRRWFERQRAQLNGQSPKELLGMAWSADDEAARRVRKLASALAGAQALAA